VTAPAAPGQPDGLRHRIKAAVIDYRKVWPEPHSLAPNLALAVEALADLDAMQEALGGVLLRVEYGRDSAVCWLWCDRCKTGIGYFTNDSVETVVAAAQKHECAE
jgi:hypothetical protein